jgi:type IV pilus assembly protein PilA
MIVVAIIGILAAIAIPNFVAMQSKSKRAEVPGNVDAIKTAELAYDASFDGFINAGVAPDAAVSKNQRDWVTNSGFSAMGWEPDGKVRGAYGVAAATTNFTVTGYCDVDGDANTATYTASKITNATLATGDEGVY